MVLTAFEKKNSVSDNTTDTVGIAKGDKRNDTATPQNTVYDSKDKEKDSFNQENTIKSFKASSFISNHRGARLHSVLRNVWGVEHCPRECWRAFKARVIRGCTTSEDKVCLCRVTFALARWHTLLGTGMAASRPSLCFYSPHFSILYYTSHLSNTSKK